MSSFPWAKVFSEVISLPSHLVQTQVIKKLLCISEPKPRASAKRTARARLCYILPDLKGLGKKRNEYLYQFSCSREIPGPSPGQTQMYSGGCSLPAPDQAEEATRVPEPQLLCLGEYGTGSTPGTPSRS